MTSLGFKLIVDTDIGDDVDDAYALAYLSQFCKEDVIGVTTVYKNAYERAQMAQYVCREWQMDCPVVAGESLTAGEPLKIFPFEEIGADGLPHISQMLEEMKGEKIERTDAADFILQCAEKYPQQVAVLAIGPMTNLGRAYRKNPDVFNRLKRLYVMGGCFQWKFAEWNIRCDPENAVALFESKVPVTLLGSDLSFKTPLSDGMLAALAEDPRRQMQTLRKMTEKYIGFFHGTRRPTMHDSLAAAMLPSDCDCLTFEKVKLRAETQGAERGMLLPDDNGKECLVATAVDLEKFWTHWLYMLAGIKYENIKEDNNYVSQSSAQRKTFTA